jgi:hypothetical protein
MCRRLERRTRSSRRSAWFPWRSGVYNRRAKEFRTESHGVQSVAYAAHIYRELFHRVQGAVLTWLLAKQLIGLAKRSRL